MTRDFILLFIGLVAFFSCEAQQKLIFTNENSGNIVIVNQGDMVRFMYRGYLGQVQDIYGRVDNINDSLVRFEGSWTIRVSDIVGFRKFNKYRDIFKGVTDIVLLVGAIVAIPAIINNNLQWSLGVRLGVSFGIGLAASGLNSLLYPTRIKNFMSAGWGVKVE